VTDCVLIATDTRLAGEQAARRAGLEPRLVIGKRDCAGGLSAIRRAARDAGLRTTAIHSRDWDRVVLPQLFELAALRIGAAECRVLLGDGTTHRSLSRTRLALHVLRLPFDVLAGLAGAGAEVVGFLRSRRGAPAFAHAADGDGVLAIWPGAGAAVGGAVTHVSGVLAAFRNSGLRVGLLTLGPPPPQLEAVADEIEIVPPLPRTARLTREIALISANRAAREAGERLLRRLRPRLIYQRHEAFATHGLRLAETVGVPLVLEWNNSEVWAYVNWHAPSPLKRLFVPIAAAMEREVLKRASLIVSVSRHSERMALDEGASPDSVIVLPNGVDIETIDSARQSEGTTRREGGLIGWVGSFTPWHGAEVLIRALALLPKDVRALLIGDGAERAASQALARELGVEDRVEFAGMLAHDMVVRELSGCDVLVSPHVQMPERPFFGSPTKIFEYMAIGRPIVASALEQIGELLEDGRTAQLVTPGDPAELARGISAVLERPDRGEGLGHAARWEAEARHTWDARVSVILDRLEDRRGVAEDQLQLVPSD
jgi:glycosyltransferase involved in cell wall biosynthesis